MGIVLWHYISTLTELHIPLLYLNTLTTLLLSLMEFLQLWRKHLTLEHLSSCQTTRGIDPSLDMFTEGLSIRSLAPLPAII